MNVMRFTIIDAQGAVSFVSDCRILSPMVAACALGSQTLTDLLGGTERFGASIAEFVTSGLAVFDEHNAYGKFDSIHGAIKHFPGHQWPVFRVVDETTRQASLQPVKAGAVIFNLRARRIVQLQNSYREIRQMTAKVRRLEQAGWRILP
ncbi:MAG TPA: hypothetical protein VMP10_01640 [Chloroflexota bacterium]|nr:hypothetical protein [Chloroflexota bacterium]